MSSLAAAVVTVPPALFLGGFLLGALPVSFGSKFLVALVITIGLFLVLRSRVAKIEALSLNDVPRLVMEFLGKKANEAAGTL